MHKFTDADGREWKIRITIGAVERVKSEFDGKVDILNLAAGDPPLISQLSADPALLCHVIFGLVRKQNGGISQDDFAEAIDARTFADAEKCFWKEIENFFQTTGRTDLYRLVGGHEEIKRETISQNVRTLDQAVQVALNLTSANLSGLSPASAD